jgi:hypothetical protein
MSRITDSDDSILFSLWRNSPTLAQAASLLMFPDHTHTHTHTRARARTQAGLSRRGISSSQRPLSAQHATNTRNEHPCPQRDSNSRLQRKSGFITLCCTFLFFILLSPFFTLFLPFLLLSRPPFLLVHFLSTLHIFYPSNLKC